jgi:hypothetical protein
LRESTEGRDCWPEPGGITFAGDVGGAKCGGEDFWCAERPGPAVGEGVAAGGEVGGDFAGIAGVGALTDVGGVGGGLAGGVAAGAVGVVALFCGTGAGRLEFKFRTPPPRLRIPPAIDGMIFCGGVAGAVSEF